MEAWEAVHIDEDQTTLQALATTKLFHFRDDIVIRVRPDPKGARIDLRSRSRVGRGDMGANAARILAFQQRYLERD